MSVAGAGVFLVDVNFEQVEQISTVPCAAVGVNDDLGEIYCPSVSTGTITKIPVTQECGVSGYDDRKQMTFLSSIFIL